MKRKNIVIGIIVLLLIGLVIYFLSNQKERTFKRVTLSHNNIITNKTSKSYLDTLVSEGLDVLGLRGEYVMIKDMNPTLRSALGPDNELRAYIIGERNQYVIYIDDLNREESLTILSHELIHLEQYSSDRLIRMEDTFIMFEGKVYNVNDIAYKNRPWEIEAFKNETDLKIKLEELLF